MIELFDNILTESHREPLYMFSITTNYKIGWDDTATFEHRQYPCLHHTITPSEWKELGIIEGLQSSNLKDIFCLLYTSPSPRDKRQSRMPSSA